MRSYGYQRIFGPTTEPVHCATTEQARKLQGTIAELLSYLRHQMN